MRGQKLSEVCRCVQLRDAFYKLCSATGAGLFSAVAGVQASFAIQVLSATSLAVIRALV